MESEPFIFNGGVYQYQWLESATGPANGYLPAGSVNDMKDYIPGVLANSTWYKRVVTEGMHSDTSDVVSVLFHALPNFIVTTNGSTLTVNPAFSGYQWYLDSVAITGATSQSYTTMVSGNYSVVVRIVMGVMQVQRK